MHPIADLSLLGALLDPRRAGRHTWELLRSLTDDVGPRYPCTPGDVAAVAWARETMVQAGLHQVRAEPAPATLWERGAEAGALILPRRRQGVVLTALGGSVGTGSRPIEAPVIEFESLEQLDAASSDEVAGKIVYLHHVMPRRRDGTGYNQGSLVRVNGPARAARKGALACLVRSIGTDSSMAPHTGAIWYDSEADAIPAAALATPEGDRLHRLLASGQPVHFSLSLDCRPLPVGESFNVLGEIPGTDLADEIVLLGAHLDSWDLSVGAQDDGAGCAIAIEAARRMASLSQRPRRTIRIALFANEELGIGGGKAYADAHRDEAPRHVVALEADQGDGRPWALRVPADQRDNRLTHALCAALSPLDIALDDGPSRGGVDISPLRALDVPFLDLRQDATRYFDFHHTVNDVLENVSRDDLEAATDAFAAAVWVIANADETFRKTPAAR